MIAALGHFLAYFLYVGEVKLKITYFYKFPKYHMNALKSFVFCSLWLILYNKRRLLNYSKRIAIFKSILYTRR